MPGKGPAYPISKEWKEQVRAAIDEIIKNESNEISSDAQFAKHAKVSKSALSEALKPGRIQTPKMPAINKALGWPAPRVLSTPDELEIWAAVEALDDKELGRMLGKAESAIAKLRKQKG